MEAARFFPGFEARTFDVDGLALRAVIGGAGPPLLLIHGAPQSRVMWRAVAPKLAERFTVVAPDLRGYGESAKPAVADYSKRRMAADNVAIMQALGFGRFRVAGHDRGARTARRLAKDHAPRVERLAILDIVPTAHIYAHLNKQRASNLWHWLFFIQREPVPETLMGPQAEGFVRLLARAIRAEPEIADEYARTNGNPEAFHAMCEDYRCGAGVDLEHDAADAGVRIACPTLVLWGETSPSTGAVFDVPAAWAPEVERATYASLKCGHFLPEEDPAGTLAALLDFL